MDIATANGLTRGQESAVLIKIAEQMNAKNIQEAAESFLRGDAEITIIRHTINLVKPPRLSSDGSEVVKHHVGQINSKKIVEIELRSNDNLYIDGKKVILHLSEKQMCDEVVVGHELLKELQNGEQILLNSNVLDYLYDHLELFPEHWKKDENGDTRYIFFWGSVFQDPSNGCLYVRYLYWDDGELYRSDDRLNVVWSRQSPSAGLAS